MLKIKFFRGIKSSSWKQAWIIFLLNCTYKYIFLYFNTPFRFFTYTEKYNPAHSNAAFKIKVIHLLEGDDWESQANVRNISSRIVIFRVLLFRFILLKIRFFGIYESLSSFRILGRYLFCIFSQEKNLIVFLIFNC